MLDPRFAFLRWLVYMALGVVGLAGRPAGNPAWAQAVKQVASHSVGHNVTALDFSPDGKTLAAAVRHSKIELLDVPTAAERGSLAGETRLANPTFSPDGSLLATSTTNVVQLWDVRTRKQKLAFTGHKFEVTGVAFLEGGKTLASCDANDVLFWDTAIGKELGRSRPGKVALGRKLAPSPDGKTLALAGSDTDGSRAVAAEVALWDVGGGKRRVILRGHKLSVSALAWAPDGKTLATAGPEDGRAGAKNVVLLWDVVAGRQAGTLPGEHAYTINQLHFGPDGRTLASCSTGEGAILWDVRRRRVLARIRGPGTFSVYAMALSPDGRILATGGSDSAVRLWDVSAVTSRRDN